MRVTEFHEDHFEFLCVVVTVGPTSWFPKFWESAYKEGIKCHVFFTKRTLISHI